MVPLDSLVRKETAEEDIFAPPRRTLSSLPRFRMDQGDHIPPLQDSESYYALKPNYFFQMLLLNLLFTFLLFQTDNILAPMITHGIYSAVILGHGLWKIHDHRRRLRQRIQLVREEGRSTNKL